jgi:membrane-associated protease RseP (regulator of RpoE activity)
MSTILSYLLVSVVHELAHAAAAAALGVPVRGVCVGVGPLVYQYTRGALVLRLRPLPIGLGVAIERRGGWRGRVIALAGPATGLVLAALAFGLLVYRVMPLPQCAELFVLALVVNGLGLATPLPIGDGWRAIAAGGSHRASVRNEA